MSMRKWVYLLVFLLLIGCGKREEKPQNQKPEARAIEVSVYEVKPEEIKVYYTTNGYFEGIKDVILKPEVSGRVLSLFVDEGQFVRAGQPLLKIDPSDYENTIRQIEANLYQARANYENQKAIYERRKFLYEQNLIAREDFEVSETQLRVLQNQVSAIEAQLSQAKLQLSRTVLKAPFSGYIAQRFVNVGDYLTPQSQTFRLLTLDPIKVVFQIPQELLSKVREGSLVEVSVDGVGSFKGKVVFVSPSADTNRLITIKALINNPKGEIKPSMYAKVQVPVSSELAFKLPETSVILLGNQKVVWKVEGDRVLPVRVEVLEQEEGFVYVKGDLREGDKVAVENAFLLNQNSRVKVR